MARFYGTKIKDGDINRSTGNQWTLEDVPDRWRAATEAWLNDNP